MPALAKVDPQDGAKLGMALEGYEESWLSGQGLKLERYGARSTYVELYTRGTKAARFRVAAAQPWVSVDQPEGETKDTTRVNIGVDWEKAPPGISTVTLTVGGFGPYDEHVPVTVVNRTRQAPGTYVEADDHVAIEAGHHAASAPVAGVAWTTIPNLGRWGSALTPLPIHPAAFAPGAGPSIDYRITLWQPGPVDLTVIASPSLDVVGKRGLRYAIAIDNEAPQVVDLDKSASEQEWAKAVADNMWRGVSHHKVAAAGAHRVRIWAIDPGVVIQRLVVGRPGYTMGLLGPVESTKAE
jgi:hypothetical protein